MNIIPGEPVPPGFEDEVNREAEIQPAIDQYKGNALVGLEYTVELNEEDRHEPGYFCVLCDKRGDPRTIMQHWTSFNHRLKYLEKHYPTAVREFNPVKYKPNSHSIMIIIVQSLAEAIEDHHGRLKLSVRGGDEFRHSKTKIISEINGKFHYDERNGPNFVNIIDRSLWEPKKLDHTLQITIKAPKRILTDETPTSQTGRDGFDEISSESDSGATQDAAKKPKKREQSPAYRVLPRVRRSPPFEEDRDDKASEKKLPTPKELSLQASHIAQERYKWEKYRCMLEIQLKQMEKLQQDYEKNPEKHPLYPEEWKKFWNRRYKELQAEKKVDPNKHDYKPEWIVFWTERMKALFNDEVEQKKKEIKVKLELPENAEEKVDQLKEKYKVQVSRNSAALGINPSAGITKNIGHNRGSPMQSSGGRNKITSGDVIDISDDEVSPQRRRRSRSRSKTRRSRSRSNSRHSSSRRIYKRSRARSGSKSSLSLSDDEFDRHHSHHHIHRHSSSRGAHASSARSYAHAVDPTDYYGSSHTRTHYVPPPPPPHAAHYIPPIPHYRVMNSYQYPKYDESQSASLASSATAKLKKKSKEEVEPEEEGPLTVVAVLRLLTALEDHLGSLGPKVVDLLGKALSLEKVKANSADDLLMNEDHCVFFETIKEKLKGLLIADVLDDPQKIRAVKKAIKNIAATVHQVNTKGNKSEEQKIEDGTSPNGSSLLLTKKSKITGKQQPNVKDLPFDRQVVATRLAAALVLQGREDVSTEDMDKLIYIFILLVKLSKEKFNNDNKPLRMNDVLSELGIPVLAASTVSALAALPAIVDELFENEVSALVQEVEEEISNDTSEKEAKSDANSNMLESLTDSDLQTLLQNFKHLSTEEQHHLVAHLKKLETADPLRVEKLRKFVDLGDMADTASTSAGASTSKEKYKDATLAKVDKTKSYNDSPAASGSRSNYSDESNEQQHRRGVSVNNPNKFSLDDEDEDDDYTFDDVFKVASSNVNRLSELSTRRSKHDDKHDSNSSKQTATNEPIVPVPSSPSALTFNPAGLKISLSDTQNIIANLMGSLQQSNNNANQQTTNKNGQARVPPQPVPMPVDHHQQQQQQQQQQHQQQQQQQHQQKQQEQQPAQQQSSMPANLMPYYQQNQAQQSQTFAGGYNQMPGNMNNTQAAAAYYGGAAAGYNNVPAAGYGGYQQWGNAAPMQNMQPYGMQNMQNFMTPATQQQQQQQQHHHAMGYNMYGRNGN